MAERAKRVQDSIDQSERDKAQANDLLVQYKARLKDAESEADAIIRKAREQAEAETEKIMAESRALAEQTLVNAKKQLEMEHQAAMEVFRKEAASLVVSAAGRLVGREIKDEDNQQYAAMLLSGTSSLLEPSSHSEPGKD